MKTRIVLAAVAMLAVAGAAFAHAAHQGPPLDMDRLALLLDLDAAQKTQVQTILESQREQARAAREQQRSNSTERPSREERRALHEQLRQDTLSKLSTVLNDLQLKKFEALTQRPMREKPAQ
jgi:Spy/CpxP family protein refolding chaperone